MGLGKTDVIKIVSSFVVFLWNECDDHGILVLFTKLFHTHIKYRVLGTPYFFQMIILSLQLLPRMDVMSVWLH